MLLCIRYDTSPSFRKFPEHINNIMLWQILNMCIHSHSCVSTDTTSQSSDESSLLTATTHARNNFEAECIKLISWSLTCSKILLKACSLQSNCSSGNFLLNHIFIQFTKVIYYASPHLPQPFMLWAVFHDNYIRAQLW